MYAKRRRSLLVGLWMLAASVPGSLPAQTVNPTAEQKADLADKLAAFAKGSSTPETVFKIAAAADWMSTAYALGHGAQESNREINWIKNTPAMITAGAATDVVGAWAWQQVTKNHPKVQSAGFIVATVFRGYVVVHNLALPNKLKPGETSPGLFGFHVGHTK
jgi:hypothetical protein